MTVSMLNMVLLVALLVKHYIADIPLQTNWMAFNKGTFLHPGGILHAALHAAFSIVALVVVASLADLPVGRLAPFILLLAVGEFLVHYLIDYGKMNLDRMAGFSELVYSDGKVLKGRLVTSNYYYWFLVGDQCLHFLTYIVMAYLFMGATI